MLAVFQSSTKYFLVGASSPKLVPGTFARLMSFSQPALPYSHDHLEPHISKETLEFHYGKHHLAYWNKTNALTKDTPWAARSLIDIVKEAEDGALLNNASQNFNHSFYWDSMKANPSSQPNPPTGEIAKMIEQGYGSFDNFVKEFSEIAAGHFGSGWAWLVLNKNKKLQILGLHDADCPIRKDRGTPLITCDVWEHAYYIDKRNDRPSYIKAWWSIVNWDFANANLAKALAAV